MNEHFTNKNTSCPTCGTWFYKDKPWKRVCLTCYLRTKGKPTAAPATPPVAPIDQTMLRRLIQLCHPDKHGNSEASNTATRFLLMLKGTSTK